MNNGSLRRFSVPVTRSRSGRWISASELMRSASGGSGSFDSQEGDPVQGGDGDPEIPGGVFGTAVFLGGEVDRDDAVFFLGFGFASIAAIEPPIPFSQAMLQARAVFSTQAKAIAEGFEPCFLCARDTDFNSFFF